MLQVRYFGPSIGKLDWQAPWPCKSQNVGSPRRFLYNNNMRSIFCPAGSCARSFLILSTASILFERIHNAASMLRPGRHGPCHRLDGSENLTSSAPARGRLDPACAHFARENELTVDEWMARVQLLNWAGKISDNRRNEGQLIYDVIGFES